MGNGCGLITLIIKTKKGKVPKKLTLIKLHVQPSFMHAIMNCLGIVWSQKINYYEIIF